MKCSPVHINISDDYITITDNKRVGVMVFSATFNNISVISWWSVLLVGNQSTQIKPPTSQVIDKLYHIMFIDYTSHERDSNALR